MTKEQQLLEILRKVFNGEVIPSEAQSQILILFDVNESTLDVPDIRNKLTPFVTKH